MNVDALYSKLADSYDVTLTLAGYKMPLQYFIRRIPFERDRSLKILDAGCGTGLYSIALAKRFGNSRIVAFDLNRKMIEKLKEKTEKNGLGDRITAFQADMTEPLPLEDGQYDLIVSAGCLEYVEIEKAVRNLKSYLRPFGYWINSPIKTNLFGQLIGKIYHLQPYSRDRNIEVFRNHGFSVIDVVEFLSLKEAHIFQKIS